MRRDEQIKRIAHNCVHFKGDRPCRPQLRSGNSCRCDAYSPRSGKILFIQLSSPVTIIRSSALVHRVRAENPNAYICYLAGIPELLPRDVNEPLGPGSTSMLRLQMDQFDTAYNLDLDRRACSVMNIINAETKMGYYLKNGDPAPLPGSQAHYLRTLFPNSSEEIDPVQDLFQLCGMEYQRDLPRLETLDSYLLLPKGHTPMIGLQPGLEQGSPYKKAWDVNHWFHLIKMIEETRLHPVLLGNTQTDTLCRYLADYSRADYMGPLPMRDYMALTGRCDVVVSTAGFTIEMAWAMGKDVVLLQTSKTAGLDSDYFRGRGITVEPLEPEKNKNSLNDIIPDQVMYAILERLGNKFQEPELQKIMTQGLTVPAEELTT
ncbi:MAG: glycosyltransferase family 9 protein [Sedimentisphaerales bacterium]|nr:glycosyltransferase family 9 protein [Sedimentisphaerales bacterium]